ncbi:hypothetical protein V6N13_041504 [Hibiscus sabdariffa]
MPESPEDPRLPKKQRRRDEDPPDTTSTDNPATMDCDNPNLVVPGMMRIITLLRLLKINPNRNNRNPFGPWMLVDKKQQRQPRKSIAADSTDNSFPMQQSRYNPIFLDNDNTEALVAHEDLVTVPIREQAHDTVAPHSTDQNNVSIHLTHSTASPVKLKAKGKLPQAARKPTALNLGLKSVNILTRKSGSSTPGSSRYTTGRSQTASLHSEKHAAVELDPSAAPITLVGNSLRKHNTIKNFEAKSHSAITNDVRLLAKKSLPDHGLIGSPVSSAVQTASGDGATIMVE